MCRETLGREKREPARALLALGLVQSQHVLYYVKGLDEDDIGEEFGTSKKSFAQRLPTAEKAESRTK